MINLNYLKLHKIYLNYYTKKINAYPIEYAIVDAIPPMISVDRHDLIFYNFPL